MTDIAKIIFLHGASSSGKSTIARALQNTIDEPFWHISIDHLRDAGVLPLARFKSGEFRWKDSRGPFFRGFHLSLAAYASDGNNLIIEHILDTDGWLGEMAELFTLFDVFFVGVHCSLPVLIERERVRGDRPPGSAEQDYNSIHRDIRYDLEIESEDGVDENVRRLIAAWKQRRPPSAFAKLSLAEI